jgi:hypothetical protein
MKLTEHGQNFPTIEFPLRKTGFTKSNKSKWNGQIIGYSGIARDITKIQRCWTWKWNDTKKNRVI